MDLNELEELKSLRAEKFTDRTVVLKKLLRLCFITLTPLLCFYLILRLSVLGFFTLFGVKYDSLELSELIFENAKVTKDSSSLITEKIDVSFSAESFWKIDLSFEKGSVFLPSGQKMEFESLSTQLSLSAFFDSSQNLIQKPLIKNLSFSKKERGNKESKLSLKDDSQLKGLEVKKFVVKINKLLLFFLNSELSETLDKLPEKIIIDGFKLKYGALISESQEELELSYSKEKRKLDIIFDGGDKISVFLSANGDDEIRSRILARGFSINNWLTRFVKLRTFMEDEKLSIDGKADFEIFFSCSNQCKLVSSELSLRSSETYVNQNSKLNPTRKLISVNKMPLDLSASFVSSKTKFSIDQLTVNLAENKFSLASELSINEDDFQIKADLNYPKQRMIKLVKVFLQKYATEDLGFLKLNLKMNALIANDMVIKKLDLDPLVNYMPPKKGISFIRNLKRDFYFDPKDGTRFLLIGKRNRNFVKYKDLKKELKYALLAAEDMSFFLHEGIEWTEIVNAMIKGSKKGKLRGASSISQQLSKNLFLVEERSITRKMQEALLAIMLEKELSKRRIFEIYVNIIQLGNKIRGIGKASKYYFGKSYGELDICEILWLSSIIPAPVANHDYFLNGEISPNSRKRMKENFSRLITWRKISANKKFECKALSEDIESRSSLINKKKSL